MSLIQVLYRLVTLAASSASLTSSADLSVSIIDSYLVSSVWTSSYVVNYTGAYFSSVWADSVGYGSAP